MRPRPAARSLQPPARRAAGWPQVTVPPLGLPYPSRLNPVTGSVIRHTGRWALATGLADGEQAVARMRRGGLLDAGPRLAPDCGAGIAYLVNDWTLLLLRFDDLFDEGAPAGQVPGLAGMLTAPVVYAFRNGRVPRGVFLPHLAGICAAAADLAVRLRAAAPGKPWLERFRGHGTQHLQSKVTEARHRASGKSLDMAGYVTLRRVTSAAYPYASLAELACGAVVPRSARQCAAWPLLLDAFADIWLGAQDVRSAAKEAAVGDPLNLAVVLAGSQPLQHGVDAACEWIRGRAADFAAQRARLEDPAGHLDAEARAAVSRYADALEAMLGGHVTWNGSGNPRYTKPAAR